MDCITIKQAKKDNADDILSFINGLAKHIGELNKVTATKKRLESTIFADNSHIEVLLAYLIEKPVR